MTPRQSDRARAFLADLAELQALQVEYAGRINMDIQVTGVYRTIIVRADRQDIWGRDWEDGDCKPDPCIEYLEYPQKDWDLLTTKRTFSKERLKLFCKNNRPVGHGSLIRQELLQ